MPVFFQIRFSSFTLFSLISCHKPSKNPFFSNGKMEFTVFLPQPFDRKKKKRIEKCLQFDHVHGKLAIGKTTAKDTDEGFRFNLL